MPAYFHLICQNFTYDMQLTAWKWKKDHVPQFSSGPTRPENTINFPYLFIWTKCQIKKIAPQIFKWALAHLKYSHSLDKYKKIRKLYHTEFFLKILKDGDPHGKRRRDSEDDKIDLFDPCPITTKT